MRPKRVSASRWIGDMRRVVEDWIPNSGTDERGEPSSGGIVVMRVGDRVLYAGKQVHPKPLSCPRVDPWLLAFGRFDRYEWREPS